MVRNFNLQFQNFFFLLKCSLWNPFMNSILCVHIGKFFTMGKYCQSNSAITLINNMIIYIYPMVTFRSLIAKHCFENVSADRENKFNFFNKLRKILKNSMKDIDKHIGRLSSYMNNYWTTKMTYYVGICGRAAKI